MKNFHIRNKKSRNFGSPYAAYFILRQWLEFWRNNPNICASRTVQAHTLRYESEHPNPTRSQAITEALQRYAGVVEAYHAYHSYGLDLQCSWLHVIAIIRVSYQNFRAFALVFGRGAYDPFTLSRKHPHIFGCKRGISLPNIPSSNLACSISPKVCSKC